jgi:hypothetical protein
MVKWYVTYFVLAVLFYGGSCWWHYQEQTNTFSSSSPIPELDDPDLISLYNAAQVICRGEAILTICLLAVFAVCHASGLFRRITAWKYVAANGVILLLAMVAAVLSSRWVW